MNRKYFSGLRVSFLILILLFLYIPWFFSSLILFPKTNCSKDHHVFCDTPSEIGITYETINIKTEDGVNLESWYIPSSSKKGIVLVHGHGGSKNEGLRFARSLNQAGFHLVLLSLRRNANQPASMGYHERKDVKSAVDFLLKEKQMDSVGVFGFSMGAATSILAMEEDIRIKAGIFSSGYASAVDVLSEAAKRDYGIPYYPLLPIVVNLINLRGNTKLETILPEEKIGNISPRPIFILHCDKDDYVDAKHADRLFSKANQPKQKWIPSCNKHELIWNFHKEEAESRTVEFFLKNL